MNKRNYFIYPILLLGALFSTCFSKAVTLGEGVPREAAINLAKKLNAKRSMGIGYSDEPNPYSSHSSYAVHFITHKHVLALVDEPEDIRKIKYEIGPGFFMPISVKSSSLIQEAGIYKVVLYELEKPIEDVKPYELVPSTEDLLKETVYVFNYGRDRKAKTAFTKGAGKEQGFIKVPFHTEDMEESESPEPDGFLIGHEDFGCSLVSKDGDSLILLGLGISNDEDHSYFVSLSDEMIEKIKELTSDPKSEDTRSTTSSILVHLAQEEKEEKPQNVSPTTDEESIQQGELLNTSTPPTLDLTNAISLTDISSLPSPSTTEEPNLFDHPLEWQAGDKVEIHPDGTWVVTHPDGKQEQRIGLVFPDMKPEEPISFKVKGVAPIGKGGVVLQSSTDSGYIVYSNGTVRKILSRDESVCVYVNGWVLTSKSGSNTWEYEDPQKPSLNSKERSYTKPGCTVYTTYPSGEIKWENSDGISIRYRDRVTRQNRDGITRIEYNDESEELSLPNGMVFKKGKDSEWKLTSSVTEHTKPHKAISYKLPDATELFISPTDGRADWNFKDGSMKVYSLDGKENFISATSAQSALASSSSSAGPNRPHQGVAQVPAVTPNGTKPAPRTSVPGFSAPIGMSLNNTPLPRAGTLPPASVGGTGCSMQGAGASSIDSSSIAASSTTRSAASPATSSPSIARNVASIKNDNYPQGRAEEITYSDGEKRVTLPNGMIFEKKQGNSHWNIVGGSTRRLNGRYGNFLHILQDGTMFSSDIQKNEVVVNHRDGFTSHYSFKGECIRQSFRQLGPSADQTNTSISGTVRVAASPARSNGAVQMATPGGLPGPGHTFLTAPTRMPLGSSVLPQVGRGLLVPMGSPAGVAKPAPYLQPIPATKSSSQSSTRGSSSSTKPAPSRSTQAEMPMVPLNTLPQSSRVTASEDITKVPPYEGKLTYEKLKRNLTPADFKNLIIQQAGCMVYPHGVVSSWNATRGREDTVIYPIGFSLLRENERAWYIDYKRIYNTTDPEAMYMYENGVIEVCQPSKRTLSVYYPNGELLVINQAVRFGHDKGLVLLYDKDGNPSEGGSLNGIHNVRLSWDKGTGLKPGFTAGVLDNLLNIIDIPALCSVTFQSPNSTPPTSNPNVVRATPLEGTQVGTPGCADILRMSSLSIATGLSHLRTRKEYEEAKKQLLKEAITANSLEGRYENEFLDLRCFSHGVIYEINKKDLPHFKEQVTYLAGFCLIKGRSQNNYCRVYKATEEEHKKWLRNRKNRQYVYPSGVREDHDGHKITVVYPNKKEICINCKTGFVKELATGNRKVSNKGYLFRGYPTVTLDWNQDTGLTAHFITPASSSPVALDSSTSIGQTSVTTSTQNSSSSTTSTTLGAANIAPTQAPMQNVTTVQTVGMLAYEHLKREIMAVSPLPAARRTTDKVSEEINFPHGVSYDLKKQSKGRSKKLVTYATAGLCLTKGRHQSRYTCSQYPCAGSKLEKYLYQDGVIEVCDPLARSVGVYYPTGERLDINSKSGLVELYDTDGMLAKSGELFIEAPTAILDWSQEKGLTAYYIPPAPTPPRGSFEHATGVEQTSTTTTTTSVCSSSPNGSSAIERTESAAEGSGSTRGAKRKRVEEGSAQERRSSQEEDFEAISILSHFSSESQKTNEKGIPQVMRPYIMEKRTSSKKRGTSEKEGSTEKGSSSKGKMAKESSATKKRKTKKGNVSTSIGSSQEVTPRRSARLSSRKEQYSIDENGMEGELPKRKRGRPRKNPINETEDTSKKSTHKTSKSGSSKKSKPSPASEQEELGVLAQILENDMQKEERNKDKDAEEASLLRGLSEEKGNAGDRDKDSAVEEEPLDRVLVIDEPDEEEGD